MVSDYKIIVDKKENVSILTHSPNGMFLFYYHLVYRWQQQVCVWQDLWFKWWWCLQFLWLKVHPTSDINKTKVKAIPSILILLLILSLFNNLKSEFNTRIHYKSIQRSINIPENRIRYTSGIYSIKAGLPSVGEVFKVSIQWKHLPYFFNHEAAHHILFSFLSVS